MKGLFNRVSDPERFFRFYKFGYALFIASWVPFGAGIVAGAAKIVPVAEEKLRHNHPEAEAIVQKIAIKNAQVIEKIPVSPSYWLSISLIGGSYLLGYGGAAYAAAGQSYYRRKSNALSL